MAVRPKGQQFQADFMHGGTRYRRSFKTKAEAEAWELTARANIKLGKPVPEEEVVRTVGGRDVELLSGVLRSAETLHWARLKGSYKAVANARLFVEWAGPKLPAPEAFKQSKIDEFIAYLIEDRKVSNSTINKYMSAISVLIGKAKLKEKPTLPWYKEGKGRQRYFTDEEEALILQTLTLWNRTREKDFFMFLIDSGARPWAEGATFKWTNINHKQRTVRFEDTKNGEHRTVPLTERAWDAVMRQPKGGDGPFTDFDVDDMNRLWDRIQSHIPTLHDAVIYTTRHTTASRLVQRGVDLRRVMVWMGHKSFQTTLKYAHLAPNHLIDALNVLEGGIVPRFGVVDGGKGDKIG